MTYRPWLLSGVHRGTKKLIRITRPLERRCLDEHPDQEPRVDRARQRGLWLGDNGNDRVGGGKQGRPDEEVPQPAGRDASPCTDALNPYLEGEVCEQGQADEAELRRSRAVAAVDVRRGEVPY